MPSDRGSEQSRISLYALGLAVWYAMDDRNLGLIAAGVAFYALFAIFPALAATIALWGFFSDPAVIETYLDVVEDLMPAEAYGLIEAQLHDLIVHSGGTIGWTTIVSFGIALYSAHNSVAALTRGLNAIHERRHYEGLMRYLVEVLLTLAMMGLAILALAVVVALPIVFAFVPLGALGAAILAAAPLLVMFLLILFVLSMLYRYGPNQDERQPWVTPGAFLAAALWALASLAFTLYLANFGRYNEIYGSIGAVIALLMWFYISAYMILLGAAVNEELARLRTATGRGD